MLHPSFRYLWHDYVCPRLLLTSAPNQTTSGMSGTIGRDSDDLTFVDLHRQICAKETRLAKTARNWDFFVDHVRSGTPSGKASRIISQPRISAKYSSGYDGLGQPRTTVEQVRVRDIPYCQSSVSKMLETEATRRAELGHTLRMKELNRTRNQSMFKSSNQLIGQRQGLGSGLELEVFGVSAFGLGRSLRLPKGYRTMASRHATPSM